MKMRSCSEEELEWLLITVIEIKIYRFLQTKEKLLRRSPGLDYKIESSIEREVSGGKLTIESRHH